MTRRSSAYLPAIDGLRAIAIAAVFLYHADVAWLPGGFLGVDLFFAISGFLITRGLLRERALAGRVDLAQFWLRRARRLLPAALVFTLAILVAALAFFPGDVRALRGVALAAFGYVTNWYLIFSDQPYFESIGRPQLLQHLWSLAVEEQFYLVWPPLLLFLMRVGGRRGALAVTVSLAVLSTVLMAVLYRLGADASRLYYGTDTHAVGLLAGAALAFLEPAWRTRRDEITARAMQVAGAGALLATLVLFAWLAEWRPFLYQGGFALAAVVSVVLIASATVPGPLARGLGSLPFRWTGLRSYSVYLWHPPVLALVAGAGLPLPRDVIVALAAALTLVVADRSYRWVETPVRTGEIWRVLEAFRALRPDTRWSAGAAGAFAAAAVVLGTTLAPAPPPPAYLAVPQIAGVIIAAPAPPAEATASAPSWTVPRELPSVAPTEQVSRSTVPVRTPTAGLTVRSLSAVVTATPGPGAGADGIAITLPGLPSAQTPTPPGPTPGATPAAAPAVLAVGDSVMLGAAHGLASVFGTIEVDAAIGRDAGSTLRILRERRAAGRLPDTVIVQVGNNGVLTKPQVEEMMTILGGVRRAIVVDLRVPQPWEEPNNLMLASAVGRHANARLVAWHRASEGRDDLFWDDMHLRPAGVDLYVTLIHAQAG